MSQSVFISYARKSNQVNARALRAALGADVCFLDEHDVELGAKFPKALTDALLAARVVVVFADATYFKRWYCLREWTIARAPYDEQLKRDMDATERDAAIAHVVVALDKDADESVVRHLPPPIQAKNWPAAGQIDRLAKLVHQTLERCGETLRERCVRAGVSKARLDSMVDEAAMPSPRSVAGVPMHPHLPPSLRDGFVGRVDDLWRLHVALTEPRLDSHQIAALTGAVQGGGGFGKTRLALEYVHRFGPTDFRGGLFWIDATEAESIERQFHGVLRALRPQTPASIDAMREAGRDVQLELDVALHEVASSQSVLFVVDNVPEPKAGVPPPLLDRWCPRLGEVTCLATSRKRLDHDASIERIDVDVLAPDAAVALLRRDVSNARQISDPEWHEIAAWVGHLPLALTLLNAALRWKAVTPTDLSRHARGESQTKVLDEQKEALRDTVPKDALRGITEAFTLSYELLTEPAKTLARKIAWLSPAPIPDELIAALAQGADAHKVRVQLFDRSFLTSARASETGGTGTTELQMHRVLADFLRTRSEASAKEPLAALTAVHAILKGLDRDRPERRALGIAVSSHALVGAKSVAATVSESSAKSSTEPWRTVVSVASLLDDLGGRTSESEPLVASIEIHQVALSLAPREYMPQDWARTQGSLGVALWRLGEREAGTQRLDEAVAAYRAALEVYTRERAPLDWAMTQNNLGSTLHTLGGREEGTLWLDEAVTALRAALEVYTRERAPLDWATIQNNLGNALSRLGEREAGTQRLDEAVAAYRAALEIYTRERAPLDWAMTQNNLGNALETMGAREEGTQRLDEAVAAYQAALAIYEAAHAVHYAQLVKQNLQRVERLLTERKRKP